jgi:hypothetical protein
MLVRKLVQGTTVAVLAMAGVQVAMFVLLDVRELHLLGLTLGLGIPSFIAAVLFFPLSASVVTSRWSLCSRVLATTAVVGAANRALLFRGDWSRFVPRTLDGNAQLILTSLAVALVFSFVAQPVMARVAVSATARP